MTVMVYSIEAWIMSLIGLMWLSVRTIYNNRSFIEEYLLYSQVILATLNLIVVSLQIDKRDACKSYFIINLVHWLLGIYCSLDSLYSFQFRRDYIIHNQTTTQSCCPNADMIQWNRKIFFAGLPIFLVPMAITQSLQTIHLIIAAGALSNTQHTLWPGVTLGYATLSIASFFMAIKFMEFFTKPCPDTTINLFDHWISWKLSTLFLFYVFTFSILGATESLLVTLKARLMWSFLTIMLILCYIITVHLNIAELNMITWPWVLFNGLGVLPCLYIFIDIMHPTIVEMQPSITTRFKNRTKFVMPIQTNISSKSSKND